MLGGGAAARGGEESSDPEQAGLLATPAQSRDARQARLLSAVVGTLVGLCGAVATVFALSNTIGHKASTVALKEDGANEVIGFGEKVESSTTSISNTSDPLKVVLYITTHGSEQHMSFLECYPQHFKNLPKFAAADVILFVGEGNETLTAEKKDRYRELVAAWPVRKTQVHFRGNPGKQAGAIKALHYGFSSGWFDEHDWVVRINPDVFFYDESVLFSLMDKPENWGVFAPCHGRCEDHTGCILHHLPQGKTHTDFFAVRPEHVPKDAFANWSQESNAEKQATRAFKQIYEARADAYIVNENPHHVCRLRAGGVWHTQSFCDVFIEYQPFNSGFCSNCSGRKALGNIAAFSKEACRGRRDNEQCKA